MIYLKDIPRGSKLLVKTDEGMQMATFNHLDGMYSHCTIDVENDNRVFHLSLFTPLELVGDYYKIINKDE